MYNVITVKETDSRKAERKIAMKARQTTYEELLAVVERNPYITTRFNVVSYLVGYNGVVTEQDVNNILRLYTEGYVEE